MDEYSKSTVGYAGYRLRTKTKDRGLLLNAARLCWRFLKNRVVYDTLLYPYGKIRHGQLLRSAQRSQSHTYTCFYRAPGQLRAIVGPVMSSVASGSSEGSPITILLFACSTGAEAYTIASMLVSQFPKLRFHIIASDLHQEMVERATAAKYSSEEVWHSEYITEEFVRETFDLCENHYVVKQEIREHVSFAQADLLDPAIGERFAPADIVFAQNVLFHLPREAATRAFENICRTMKPRSVLFIEGMDLDLKCAATQAGNLQPLEFMCREIYEQSRVHIPLAWWRYYYGSEPYAVFRPDRKRRYCSIFLKDESSGV